MIILYQITNKITGKIYFGVTSRGLKIRWRQHCSFDRPNTYLRGCIRKYGKNNFTINIVAEFPTYKLALDAEKLSIFNYRTNICRFPDGIGMNMTDGGDRGNIGYKTTDLHKSNLSAAMKGRKKSTSHRRNISRAKKGKNNPNYGKKPSDKSREIARLRFSGDQNPMRGKFGENNPLFGKKRPEKIRKKLLKAAMEKARAVYKLDNEGKIIEKFPSTHEACRAVGIKNGVHAVCTGKRKTAGGFRWRFVK